MRFDIVTIFPGFFESIFAHGIVRRALKEGLVTVEAHDLREYAHDRHRTVDDRPFGGGEGMLLKPEPLAEALEAQGLGTKGLGTRDVKTQVILLSAQGRLFTQAVARELAAVERVVLICGRYEGVDERVSELYCDMELSIGDYVLSGGELAAAVVVDATMRLIPGVLGNEASGEFESFGATRFRNRRGDRCGCARGSAIAARSGRAAGLSAVHEAGGVWRAARARGADEWGSCADKALAAGAAVAQDAEESAGAAGARGAERGRPEATRRHECREGMSG